MNDNEYRDMARCAILTQCLDYWSEYIEMYEGQEWKFIALNLVAELDKAYEIIKYHERLRDARIPPKHS